MANGRKTGGRKAGTPNRRTALLRAQVDDADPLAFLAQVLNGEPVGDETPRIADRLVAARELRRVLIPDARERPMSLCLPPVNSAADAPAAFSALLAATAEGEVTASEARALADILGATIKAFEVADLAERISALERRLSPGAPT